MANVWDNGPDDPTERAVLLYLANRADDDGMSCFPSKSLISEKTRFSERTVQRTLLALEKGDWLSLLRGNGRGVLTQYDLNVAKLKQRHNVSFLDSEIDPERETCEEEKGDIDDTKGRHSVPERETMTPSVYKEDTSLTINDPPKETPANLVLVPQEPWYPSWLPVETWHHYEVMRKKIKKPMTDEAKRLAIRKLDVLRKSGNDPQLVLEESIMNSWQGLFELRKGANGNGRSYDRNVRATESVKEHLAAHASDQTSREATDVLGLHSPQPGNNGLGSGNLLAGPVGMLNGAAKAPSGVVLEGHRGMAVTGKDAKATRNS